jgi:transcription elongation factor GreA
MQQTMLITSAGLIQLKKELDDLVNIKRPQLVDRLSFARSQGDLSENSDYQSAKEELVFMDGRIAELEDLLKNAKISSPSISNKVDFGHSVTVKVGSREAVFQIVGEWEADPAQKKISHTSPLGQALMGKKVGDQVEVSAPAGKILYTVTAIS